MSLWKHMTRVNNFKYTSEISLAFEISMKNSALPLHIWLEIYIADSTFLGD